MSLYRQPTLDDRDREVLTEIHGLKADLAAVLRVPARWRGALRRTSRARAIRGSNSIEGINATPDDALAVVDDQPPLTADDRVIAEITAYRRVLTYVLHMIGDPDVRPDLQTIKSLHFFLLEHDLEKSPGQFRSSDIYVHDELHDRLVYRGPDPEAVPALMGEFADELCSEREGDPIVVAAMAHLNLVMIHPFRDGNGRMARILQTFILGRDGILEPDFSSIEEWLGRNTEDYYTILAATGRGAWNPGNDAHDWVRFTLRAHHMQAHTVRRRFDEVREIWNRLLELGEPLGLPERSYDALVDAALGYRVQRPGYATQTGVEDRTATRDLKQLVDAGLLDAHGQTRGRYYVAGEPIRQLRQAIRAVRTPLADPYPDLMRTVRASTL
ncbi:Fic family protein [Raineyella sp. W15-4]|uniref:Fic family protein n=1 Tax=Raineyella sp. W15-4 TaxID=3081651 RepID=UPI002953F55E|nr:Fic family protein [Raineyella sp. W15-4]WOQ17049.1 Fic family protein [Raineyella sp. W15-4]